MFRSTILAMAVLLGIAAIPSGNARAAGGEDFPFFCWTGNEATVDAIKVVADDRSTSGYMLMLIRNGYNDGYIPVSVKETTDGKYWQVYGIQYRYTLLSDRHVLAYINKETGEVSHEDVKVTMRGASGRDWRLKPMSCGVQP
jgi:hypothetical protein